MNEDEAGRVVKLALFFVTQGYSPSEITVLGAYSGQVALLRQHLENELPSVWSGQLSKEAERHRIREIEIQLQQPGMHNAVVAQKHLELAKLYAARAQVNMGDLGSSKKHCKDGLKLALKGSIVHCQLTTAMENLCQILEQQTDLDQLWQSAEGTTVALLKMTRKTVELARRFQVHDQLDFSQATFGMLAYELKRYQENIDDHPGLNNRQKVLDRLQAEHANVVSLLECLRRDINSIDVQTIDRYQGAENNIIIVSLVRSEKLGYLDEINRRCVAQSRAKCGLYFVGNARLFRMHDTWKGFLARLTEDGNVATEIALQCSRHPRSIVDAKTSGDVDLKEGVCQQTCLAKMAFCDHLCQKRCHADDGHLVCDHEVLMKCPQGHLSHRKCSEGSDGKCDACDLIAKLVLEQKQENERKQIENCLRKVRCDIASGNTGSHRRDLQEHGADASEYRKVMDRTELYAQSGHGIPMTVTRIEKVTNLRLEEDWFKAKLDLIGKNHDAELLFHGTSVAGVEGIITTGFRLPKRSENNMFGCGVYFANDSTKSAQDIYTKGSKRLLLCDVVLGATLTVEGLKDTAKKHSLSRCIKVSSKMRPYLDVHLPQVRNGGFDSVYAKRGTRENGGVEYDEFVIYDPRLALPKYIVHFGGASGAKPFAPKRSMEIFPSRSYSPGSEEDMAFRLAESQFHRMLANSGTVSQYEIVKVEYTHNDRLRTAFDAKRSEYDRLYGSHHHETRLGFHGTKEEHLNPILKNGFDVAKVGTSTDPGYWGAGIYFSENTVTSIGYSRGLGKLLLSQILLGKPYIIPPGTQPYKVNQSVLQRLSCIALRRMQLRIWKTDLVASPVLQLGRKVKEGFDTHILGDGDEIVVFDNNAMLPMFVIHYR